MRHRQLQEPEVLAADDADAKRREEMSDEEEEEELDEEVFIISKSSAVTIIVVTIFIATFQNYRIVFLSRYFLCVRNDIFARHLRYASIIDSPPVYSIFSTLQSRFNHVPRTT